MVKGQHRYFTFVFEESYELASSSNRINSKFKRSFKFVIVNANAKCVATVGFSKSVNIAFVHLIYI